jgi:hypothetical protein
MFILTVFPFKLIGRWVIRLCSCNAYPDLVAHASDEYFAAEGRLAYLAVEVTAFWILPLVGFFVAAVAFALIANIPMLSDHELQEEAPEQFADMLTGTVGAWHPAATTLTKTLRATRSKVVVDLTVAFTPRSAV